MMEGTYWGAAIGTHEAAGASEPSFVATGFRFPY